MEISIEDPSSVSPCALFPNPTKAGTPANPPAMVVTVIGSPDANGIIAPVPAAPVAPSEMDYRINKVRGVIGYYKDRLTQCMGQTRPIAE